MKKSPPKPAHRPRIGEPALDIASELNPYVETQDTTLGQLELAEPCGPDCDPYNNTGTFGIKTFLWRGIKK